MKRLAYILLLGYVVGFTNGCKSGRLLASTLPNVYGSYQYTAGIYVKQEQELNDAPLYKHELLDYFLRFEPIAVHGAAVGGYWVVSSNLPGGDKPHHDILLALSTANSPDDVRETWQVRNKSGTGWTPEPTFSVQCVTKSKTMCPYGDIVLTGLHERHSVHDRRMGLYVFTDLLFQERPVFYHEETNEYLFFLTSMWLVGEEIGSKQGSMFVMDYAYDPEFITNTWVVFNRKYFAPDDGLRVMCPNVTEVDTDVVYDYDDASPQSNPDNRPDRESESLCPRGYCQNEGSCSGTRNGAFICLCKPGFTGERCERAVSCSKPPSISNGQPIIPPGQGDTYPFLSTVRYMCERGFYLNSPSHSAVCDGNGRWGNIPKCRVGNFHLTPQAGVMSTVRDFPTPDTSKTRSKRNATPLDSHRIQYI